MALRVYGGGREFPYGEIWRLRCEVCGTSQWVDQLNVHTTWLRSFWKPMNRPARKDAVMTPSGSDAARAATFREVLRERLHPGAVARI
jgi:hypothetical protein